MYVPTRYLLNMYSKHNHPITNKWICDESGAQTIWKKGGGGHFGTCSMHNVMHEERMVVGLVVHQCLGF